MPALDVHTLSKRYRIGLKEARHDTFMGAVASWARSPLQNYRQLKKLNAFDDTDSDDVIWALKNVSFQVDRGEVVGIIGHNGAGKSTLLKVLSRITEPTSGWADIGGRVSSLLEVGTGFHKELTGRENVYLNGTILGMTKPEVDAKFDAIVAFSGVEKFIDTPVKRYSSGMKVRLAFSVAAHLEPEILMIDEVLAVGDAEFQKKCLGKMNEVAGEGRTVLFVSHNMVAVQSLCSRVIWMHHGVVAEDGDANEIVGRYLRSADGSTTAQVWDDAASAPGNEVVRIHKVEVVPGEASDAGLITMESNVFLQFDYWNMQPDAQLHLTLKILDERGIIAFGTSSKITTCDAGLYRSVCEIPANLLNSGVYYVNLLVVQNGNAVIFRHERIVSFEVIETGRGFGWYGKEQGVVRPRLDWETTQMESENS